MESEAESSAEESPLIQMESQPNHQFNPPKIMSNKDYKVAVKNADVSPKSWTHEQLLEFIKLNGLDKYLSYIKDENHTGSTILGLTKDVLALKMSLRDSVQLHGILGKLNTLEKAYSKKNVQPETTLESEPSAEEYIQMESEPTQQFIPPKIMDDKDFKVAVEKADLSPKSWTHEQLLEFFGFNGLDKYVPYIKAENHTGSTILGLSKEVLLLKMGVRDCLELIRVLGRLRTLGKAYTKKNGEPEMTQAVEVQFDMNRKVVPYNIGKSEMRRRATFNDLPWHYTHKVGQDGKVQNTYNSKIFYGWVYTTGLPDCPERLETSPALNLENPASFKTPQRGPDECWENDTNSNASGLKSTVNADDSRSKPNSTPMTCYNCGELGHGSRNCANPPSANSRGRGRGRGVGRGGGFNNSRGGGRGGWNNNQSSNTSFVKPSMDDSWDEDTTNSTPAVKSVVNLDESWDEEPTNNTPAVKPVVNVDESWDNETTNSTPVVKPIVNADVSYSWDDIVPDANVSTSATKRPASFADSGDECWEADTSSSATGLKSNEKADDSWSKPNSTPMTCYNCGELGHGSRNCANPPSANSRGRGRGRGVGRGDSRSAGGYTPMTCYNCGEQGHGSRNCTNPPSANSRGRGRGAGRTGGFENSRGGGGRWNNNNQSSNTSFPKPSMDDSWDDDTTNTPAVKSVVNLDESWDDEPTNNTPVVKPIVNADVSYSWDDIVPAANVSTTATKRPASFADSRDDVGTSRSSYTKQKASTDESWVGPTPSKRQRPSIDEESWD